MDTKVTTLAALAASVLVWNVQDAAAQANSPPQHHSNAAGDDVAGANFGSQRQPAGHND